jgi:hypothetical protein
LCAPKAVFAAVECTLMIRSSSCHVHVSFL